MRWVAHRELLLCHWVRRGQTSGRRGEAVQRTSAERTMVKKRDGSGLSEARWGVWNAHLRMWTEGECTQP
jgi:hypothetical protein